MGSSSHPVSFEETFFRDDLCYALVAWPVRRSVARGLSQRPALVLAKVIEAGTRSRSPCGIGVRKILTVGGGDDDS